MTKNLQEQQVRVARPAAPISFQLASNQTIVRMPTDIDTYVKVGVVLIGAAGLAWYLQLLKR